MLANTLADPTFWLGAIATIATGVVTTFVIQWIGGKPRIIWCNSKRGLSAGLGEKRYPSMRVHELVILNVGRRQASELQVVVEGEVFDLTVRRVKSSLWGVSTLNFDEKPVSDQTTKTIRTIGFGHLDSNERLELTIWTNFAGNINSVRVAESVGREVGMAHVFYREIDLWKVVVWRMIILFLILFLIFGKAVFEILAKKPSP